MDISEEEYLRIKDIVNKYEQSINAKLVTPKMCIVCKKNEVIPIMPENTDYKKIEDGMWDGGVVDTIHFGYGSIHDMDKYYITICDSCATNLIEEGLFINTNYNLKNKI